MNVSARHGELFDTEFGRYRLPEHRQMVKASDPAQTWFDIEQRGIGRRQSRHRVSPG